MLEALLYSNVFISFCAFFLTIETYLLAGLPVFLPMAVFVFMATLFTYNLSSIQSILLNPRQLIVQEGQPWGIRHKRLLAITGLISIGAAAVVYFRYGLRINFWFIVHLAVLSVGYTIPIIYKREKVRPLRSIPLLKVFLITYVWAAVTTLFPLMHAEQQVTWSGEVLELFGRRFLFIGALALLFDIRDYSYDRDSQTLTFPGLIGIRNTKLLSLGLLLFYTLLSFLSASGSLLLMLLLGAVVAATVVVLSAEDRPRIYYALLADGAMLVHAGLVYIAFS